MTTNNTPRIAIIGGGPAGLTLARVLQVRGISSTVFERESSPTVRSQGGTLDMHPDSGQIALHAAELDAEFRKVARYEDQDMKLLDQTGQNLLSSTPSEDGDEDRPEVDRTELRNLLLNSLEEGVVKWGYNLRSIGAVGNNRHELAFENGHTETFDLVVGADGAWSRVRPILSDAQPFYTGVTFVETGVDDVDESHHNIAELVGHGSMFALVNNKGFVAQRNGHGHIRTYVGFRAPEKWEVFTEIASATPAKARAILLDLFADWDENLLALLRESNDSFIVRPLYMMPIGHSWEHHPGVTLLGDAAHLQSPFSGEGANLAMLDGAELAIAISENSSLDAAVQAYETEMFTRAKAANIEAAQGLDTAFSDDAPQSILNFFNELMGAPNH